MEINSSNYLKYNKLLPFGYNIKIPKYNSERYFTNVSELFYPNNKAEQQKYLQAVKDFRNKKFDGTKLYDFYKSKISTSGEFGEYAYSHWQNFWDKLTAKPTNKKDTKGLFKGLRQLFNGKNNPKPKADLRAMDVDITGYQFGGVDFFGGPIPPEVRIKIGNVDYFIPLKDSTNPEWYLERDVFSSADGIYKFMDKIDSTLEQLIKDDGDYWVKYSL